MRSGAPSCACAGPQGARAGAGGPLQLHDAGLAAAGLHQGGRPAPQGQLRAAPCVPHAALRALYSLSMCQEARLAHSMLFLRACCFGMIAGLDMIAET